MVRPEPGGPVLCCLPRPSSQISIKYRCSRLALRDPAVSSATRAACIYHIVYQCSPVGLLLCAGLVIHRIVYRTGALHIIHHIVYRY